MSRKYMDFAPRCNADTKGSSATTVPLRTVRSGLSSQASLTSRAPRRRAGSSEEGHLQSSPSGSIAQCAKDALTTSAGCCRSFEEEGHLQSSPSGYWGVEEEFGVDELGVVKDLETGAVEEDIERFSGEDEGVASIEDLRKPIDDRAGFKEGKSPFINTDKLEKRPLSAFRRGGKGPMPTKNSYVEQKKVEKEDNVPTMVVTGAGKGSGFSLAIIIILVTILGAVVGFVVYLAFFQ